MLGLSLTFGLIYRCLNVVQNGFGKQFPDRLMVGKMHGLLADFLVFI